MYDRNSGNRFASLSALHTGRGYDIHRNTHHVVLLMVHGRRHVMQELYSTRVENGKRST